MVDDIELSTAQRLAWESTRDRNSWTYNQFLELTKDWKLHPVKGGAVLTKGPEIHVCIFPNSMTRKPLQIMQKLLKEYGEVFTSTDVNNLIGESFVVKRGFKKVNVIGNIQYWRLTNGN